MKNSLWSLGIGTAFSLAVSSVGLPSTAFAQTINLPEANCGFGSSANNCLVFGDFSVYSLGLLSDQQKQFGLWNNYDFTYKPNEALINVIDGAGQGTTLQGLNTAIDDPFRAMTGTINNSVYTDNNLFLMSAAAAQGQGGSKIPSDPDGGPATDNSHTLAVNNSGTYTNLPGLNFANNTNCLASMNNAGCMQSWDSSVSALTAALNGKALVFMFGNNETGDSGTLAGQDLLGWGRVTLYGANGAVTFDLSGANTVLPAQSNDQTLGVDDILTNGTDKWAHVHSEICVNDTTGEVQLNACAQGQTGWHTVNQSLGVDQAGFALFSKALNDALYSGNYTGIAVDIRLSHLNDGADNVWIMAGNITNQVPEPGTTALFGLALLSLVAIRRRQTPQ